MQTVSKLISEAYRGRRNPTVDALMTITRNDQEYEVAISGTYIKGSPGSMYKRNGDPGDPPEPTEIEDLGATDQDGGEVQLTDREIEEATEILMQKAFDDSEDSRY